MKTLIMLFATLMFSTVTFATQIEFTITNNNTHKVSFYGPVEQCQNSQNPDRFALDPGKSMILYFDTKQCGTDESYVKYHVSIQHELPFLIGAGAEKVCDGYQECRVSKLNTYGSQTFDIQVTAKLH